MAAPRSRNWKREPLTMPPALSFSARPLAGRETRQAPAAASATRFDPSRSWVTVVALPTVSTVFAAWLRLRATEDARDDSSARLNGCARTGDGDQSART